jgi:hypothetical protein
MRWAFPFVVGAAFTAAGARAAAPPRVAYVVEEVAGSWQPIEPADIGKTIEHAALEILSKPGLIQLERAPKRAAASEPKADYLLTIEGRTVDEAETHTVYLTFGPGVRTDIASFRASDSVQLSKQTRGAMLSAIEGSARRAAKDLLEVLKPQLELAVSSRTTGPPPKDPGEGRELPWRWPEVQIPRYSSGRASLDLYSKDQDVRDAALRELTSLALGEASPRNVLERCVLEHADRETRLGCLRALRPLSRKIAPTQRVVIQAFRKAETSELRNEAGEQMTYFTGLAREEAIQAWLESLAKCETNGPLDQLGDIANLDLAIKRCFASCGKKPKYQRSKRLCIEALKPVPLERRRRIVWPYLEATDPESPSYLEGAGEGEGSRGTDWQWAAESLLEGIREWDPALEEILWRRYQRTLSSSSLDMLADFAPATPKLMERMLEVLQTTGTSHSLAALKRIARENQSLRPAMREKLAELVHTGNYPKDVSKDQLEDVIRELAKEEKR